MNGAEMFMGSAPAEPVVRCFLCGLLIDQGPIGTRIDLREQVPGMHSRQ
jgi:hypothetical protein